MEQKHIRYFDTEMRALRSEEDNKMQVEGYALKWDKETQIGSDTWGWKEKISRSAMDTANISDVILNFNHSWDSVLARTTNGSLMLSTDDVGLKINAELVDTSQARDVYKMIDEGLINRMSFAVEIKKSEWEDFNDDRMDIRTITEFGRFYDVSAVTFPAYDDTVISARDSENSRELEQRKKEVAYRKQIKQLNEIMEDKK